MTKTDTQKTKTKWLVLIALELTTKNRQRERQNKTKSGTKRQRQRQNTRSFQMDWRGVGANSSGISHDRDLAQRGGARRIECDDILNKHIQRCLQGIINMTQTFDI